MINHLSCVCMWVWLHWQTLLYCIFTILACCKGPKGLEVHWLVGSMQLPHANLTKYHPSWHSAGRQEYLVSTFSRCRKKGERTYAIVLIPSIINNTIQIKLRWALFVTYTIIQSIMRSEMCSAFNPSKCTWSSGQPTVQRPGSSRKLPAGAGIRTHNLGLPRVSSPTLYPLGHDCCRLRERCCKKG